MGSHFLTWFEASHVGNILDTRGVFYFPSVAALSGEGGVANYDNDRIIFYPKANASQMLAVVSTLRVFFTFPRTTSVDTPPISFSSSVSLLFSEI